ELSGTPSAAGTFNFTVTATDANGEAATRALSLRVYDPPVVGSTPPPPDAYQGRTYSFSFTASGGRAPFAWSTPTGTPPAGLSLGATTGTLAGTPTATGTSVFTVRATDANGVTAQQQFQIVTYAAPTITTAATLAEGYAGVPYSAALAATGGRGSLTWSLGSGSALPAGLSLNAATGALSGTPTASTPSPASFEVVVTDQNGVTGTRTFSLRIQPAPSITTTSLADGYTGAVYNATLAGTGGKTPYAWAVQSGSLPAGITLGSGGALNGTPTAAGPSSFVVRLTDDNGLTATQTLALQVYAPPAITTTSLPDGYTGSAYSATLAHTGGKAAFVWSVSSGTLPAGLTLDAGTGALSGTPTAPGTANVTFRVQDANGRSATQPLSITVYAPPAVTTPSLAEGYRGEAYAQTLTSSGGKAPITFELAGGTLHAGLTLDAQS
ncbi:MAG: putative Ig domain-containing protein, partial [Myxococcales bacterium]